MRRGQPGIVLAENFYRFSEPIAEIIGQIEMIAIGHGAVGFGDLGIADCFDALGLAVVDNLVGFQYPALVIDLHVADRGNRVVVFIMHDLARLDQHAIGVDSGGGGAGSRSRGLAGVT